MPDPDYDRVSGYREHVRYRQARAIVLAALLDAPHLATIDEVLDAIEAKLDES